LCGRLRVGNNMEQFGDSSTPDRCDKAEPGKMSSDRINYRGLLADEQMGGEVKHQAAQPSVGTKRMLALVTAWQIASTSAISLLCRLT
jgi:hypothetical protein